MLIKSILIIIAITLLWIIIGVRIIRKFVHFPAPPFIGALLDSNHRRRLQPPEKVIERSGIKKGMKVLEVGCGSGAYITFVARAIGKKGKVYALDIQPKMLEQLKKKLSRLENKDIKNIKIIKSGAYKMPFKNNFFDAVYMITVLEEIPNKQKALKEIKRVLKPKGILAVTELLVDPDYALKSTTIKTGEKAGFIFDKASGNLWNYTARFKK